jgi:hypothetical protein
MMRFGLVVAAVLSGVLGIGAAAAPQAEPPPGAVMSDSLEYVTRVPGTSQVVEGKFDRARGRDILIITGRFGFKTLDVSDPTNPQVLDTFMPAEILGPLGYWQDEDMDIDTRRNLIIGALDPRHDNVDQASCPGIGTSGTKTRNPGCRSGFYVISYADPENLVQVGDFVDLSAGHTVSCIDQCNYVWTGGPARRNDQTSLGPFTPGGRGDGRPIWVTDLRNPTRPVVFPEPIDLWRNDGLTDCSHDVDVDDNGIAWTSGRGGLLGYATQGRWRDPRTDELRNARPWDPILVAGRHRGRPGRRRAASDRLHPQRGPAADRRDPCSRGPGRERRDHDRGGLHRPVQRERADRCGRHHGISRRRARDELDPRQPVPAPRPERIPPNAGRADDRSEQLVLCPLLRDRRLDRRGRLVRTGAASPRCLRRTQPAAGRVLLRHGRRPGDESELVDVGRCLARDLVYMFDMSRGIEILRLSGGPSTARSLPTVEEPAPRVDVLAARPVAGLTPGSFVCPLFETPAG